MEIAPSQNGPWNSSPAPVRVLDCGPPVKFINAVVFWLNPGPVLVLPCPTSLGIPTSNVG